MEIKITCRRGFVSQTTQIVVIRSFAFPCPRCRRRRG